jgi:hypothetical protein
VFALRPHYSQGKNAGTQQAVPWAPEPVRIFRSRRRFVAPVQNLIQFFPEHINCKLNLSETNLE